MLAPRGPNRTLLEELVKTPEERVLAYSTAMAGDLFQRGLTLEVAMEKSDGPGDRIILWG